MVNRKDERFVRVTSQADNSKLCFIDIGQFMAAFPEIPNAPDFRRIKAHQFSPSGELARFFDLEDFQKINRFKVLKKQVEWMAGKIAVKRLVAGLAGCSEGSVRISAEKGGKPYLPTFPEMDISISHSADIAVAAIGYGHLKVAVDIEQVEVGRMDGIGRVAFSKRELEVLEGKGDADKYLAWTVKEAYLKIIGKGFAEGLKTVEYLNGLIYHHGAPVEGLTICSSIIESDYAFTFMYR